MGVLCGVDGRWQLLCIAPHAPDGGPGGGLQGFVLEAAGQGFFDRIGGQSLVVHPCKDAGDRRNGFPLFAVGQFINRYGQGLSSVFDPVDRQQDLQDVTVGLAGVRDFTFPALCSLQSGFSRSGLQCDFNSALKQDGIACFAGCVQQQRKTGTRRALTDIEFAQQQLVEQPTIHVRVVHAGRRCTGWFCRLQ